MRYLIVMEYQFATPAVFQREEFPEWDKLPDWMKEGGKRITAYELTETRGAVELWSHDLEWMKKYV